MKNIELNTPLIQQYLQIKSKYPNYILLYRIGDFYETFFEDAEITSKTCNIILTKRNNGAAGDVPLAGFPHHQIDNYLPKLVSAGYRVAICEQVEDPKKAKGIVRREVIEVVTPGITLSDKLLSERRNNFVASIFFDTLPNKARKVGFSFSDVSTGDFFVSEFELSLLPNILETLDIKEVVISKSQKNIIEPILNSTSISISVTKLEPWIFDFTFAKETLLKQFETHSLKGFGIEEFISGIISSGALLYYINETQQKFLSHIRKISIYNPFDFMNLDSFTKRNLELYSSISNIGNGLFAILDKTQTPMGSRMLKQWIVQPLIKLEKITNRLDNVEIFFKRFEDTLSIRDLLSKIPDIERIIARVCSYRALPRELIILKQSLRFIPEIFRLVSDLNSEYLKEILQENAFIDEVIEIIQKSINDEPSNSIGSGFVICKGYNSQFDKLVDLALNSKEWITKYQDHERKRTNIPSLKIGYNQVFGYYIEVTKTHLPKIPSNYERKQTLTNAERYTTPELRNFETELLNIEQKIIDLETELYRNVLQSLSVYVDKFQTLSKALAELDCFTNLAFIAKQNNYTKPIVDESKEIDIVNGRHPVVEKMLPIGEKFEPNSTFLNDDELIHIITGPNMSGKSCYLRQVGLIVLLAQIGSFVPAERAKIGVIDRIFTRVGAQDNISQGESTFLVEMQEAANILNNATDKSLILLDEVGRGTATFDGISIAWSIAEYIHNKIRAKTLFATHYHELNELEAKYDNIVNYFIEVLEEGDKVVFTHRLKRGSSDHSFGIYVAEMAGLPKETIERAREILNLFESSANTSGEQNLIKITKPQPKKIRAIERKYETRQLAIFNFSDDELRNKIISLDINNITPVEALKFLEKLQSELKINR
ncbi:MAG: DNA mismatch repair protein MutS [Candidatus Kapaibacteriales bacterium]